MFPMLKTLRLLVLLLPALGSVACTGWPRGWNEARRTHTSAGPGGAWVGTWTSESTGHTGKLRCAVFPKNATLSKAGNGLAKSKLAREGQGEGEGVGAGGGSAAERGQIWEYRYRASWARVLCAGFTVDCTARQQKDGSWTIAGARDLGPIFGGVFSHEATVDGDRLEAQYRSAADRGTLSLERVRK